MLILPFWSGPKGAKAAAAFEGLTSHIAPALQTGDFTAEEKSSLLLYSKGSLEPRIYLLGLGKAEKLNAQLLRNAYGEAVKLCHKKKIKKVNLLLPTLTEVRGLPAEECIRAISEGVLLANYKYEQLHSVKEETSLVKSVQLVGIAPKLMKQVQELQVIAEGVYLARNLINGSAHTITPSYLAKVAEEIADSSKDVEVTVFDRKRILQQKMGLLAAVAAGASEEPRFIILSYKGRPKVKDHTVVIGKGITYDTGGLNLKPTGSMETMRTDMSGAACALAVLSIVTTLKLPVNVTAVIPSTENAIDAKSYKPGDVYTAYDGTTVEIGNTDAEGRLALADAISYSIKELEPTRMIDFATLTGSAVIALGNQVAALFSNNQALADSLLKASEKSGESLWQLPLYIPYEEQLKSKIADLSNCGGRPAGAITAALFLHHFVTKNIPWAHVDIAGTAYQEKELNVLLPKNAVGFGVRFMIDFLKSLTHS